jgi:hypothetical protein
VLNNAGGWGVLSGRRQFGLPTLPFYYVLLAAGHTSLLREAQVAGASRLPHTSFASAVDLGAAANEYLIPGHPPRKQEVGRRLSLVNRALIYKDDIDFLGPQVIASKVSVTQVTRANGGVHTSVVIPFTTGRNGWLHFNGTGGCSICCSGGGSNADSVAATGGLGASDRFSNQSSPVVLLDPDLVGTTPKVYKTETFEVDPITGVLTATLPGWNTSAGRAEVRFLFDNSPQCALYNGRLSGPDSVYAAVKHLGIVAQSWRGNVTVIKVLH